MSAGSSCPHCSSPLPVAGRFCSSCGHSVAASAASPTVQLPQDGGSAARPRARAAPPEPARFLPGAVLAGRYRIMGLLGRGGMGEVYRADDLKLGQAVALKFLPPDFEAGPERLQRFLDEVRTARQVSHANVCRIYDAGEADGQHFLSMEYVDGEDLASLLRRIGRLPKEKAIQIARQLCAGLHASHEIGVLHRDLKPSNVMIDGRGRARITDFGLAAFVEEVKDAEVGFGTPAYMAPEQLAGREVSVKSDLYSLGLVLYELFTGKPAFSASSVNELRRLQSETTPSSPSSLVEGFDPSVERVLFRCLDPDPARRPASALAVAAALPGGDPLAAALAAGETPSPEMVAEAGEQVAVSSRLSVGALAVFLLSVLVVIAISSESTLVGRVPLEKPPAFLAERAREILAEAGHTTKAADRLFDFTVNQAYLGELRRRGAPGAAPWDALSEPPPSGIVFRYRESPVPLVRHGAGSLGGWMEDPPSTVPGMARVVLDPDGRLSSLLIVPGERREPGAASAEPDWAPLLHATGIDEQTLAPADPEWVPAVFADRRAAWTGAWPGKPDTPVRIEAAALGGRPVALRVVGHASRAEEPEEPEPDLGSRISQMLNAALFVVVVVVASLVALRNVRRGRGDRRGALRFALYLGAIRMLWFLGAHHVASSQEIDLFLGHLSYAMQRVGLAYVFYLAVEPYARRLWPRMLVSWVRILEGGFRDPVVGRDLLVGCAAGALGTLIDRLVFFLPEPLGGGRVLAVDNTWTLEPLRGTLSALVSVVGIHTQQLLEIIFPVTLLLIFRLLFRRTAAALVACSLLALVLFYPGGGNVTGYVLGLSLVLTISLIVLFRFGLLSFATLYSVAELLDQLPLILHPAGWYLGTMLLLLALVLAPALWGFWASRAGRPLFRDEILEPAPGR